MNWAELIPDAPFDWRFIPLNGHKQPIDPNTGENMLRWTQQEGYDIDGIAELNGVVRAVGLLLGPASSGVLAVDFDGPNAPAKFREIFGRDPKDLPPTVGVTSGKPSRGQRFFQVDQDWWQHLRGRKVWRDEKGKICLELRWSGCQSVIAGEHPETSGYRWLDDSSPEQRDVALAPDWLLEPLNRDERRLEPVETSSEDAARAVQMLKFIDPLQRTDYDSWIEVGMALHHTDEGLLSDWVEWCRPMANFDEDECLRKWESFKTPGTSSALTIRSLHHWGKAGGYKEPKKHIDGDPAEPPLSEWEQQVLKANQAGGGDPVAVSDAKMALLEQRALEVINSSRPIRSQKAAIKAIAHSLGFKPDNNFISELYDQLDNSVAAYEPDVEPGGVFTAQSQSWLLHEIFLVGLNLLVGMPGASKSRLLVALIRAFLADQSTFISRQLQPGSNRHVLLVGTDQDRQQWGALLAEAGLVEVLSQTKNDDGTETVEYQLHNNITLLTSGGGFCLNADGMRRIRDWCRAHPGGLLIVDSLSAVLPPGVKEGDETAGRLMRQIEVARQGNCCIVTHHSNKNSAKDGELGVYSGSGSGSIDRAVSRFIGLGFETHMQNGREKLHEDSPRRILTSQKRGATNQRLVLENGHHNTWDYIGTAAEMRELQRAAEDDCSPEERLKGWKKDVYGATTTDWLTTTEVFDRIDPERAKSRNAKQQVRESLRKLASDHQLIEQEMADGDGTAEVRWRRKPQLLT